MRDWPAKAVRTVGILNILFGAVGLYLTMLSIRHFSPRATHAGHPPYEPQAYWAIITINFAFLLVLVFAGWLLWRLDQRGVRLCNWLLSLEIVYWLGYTTLGLFLSMANDKRISLIGLSMGAVGGIGHMGLVPQIVTLYPVVILIVMNVAYRRLRHS